MYRVSSGIVLTYVHFWDADDPALERSWVGKAVEGSRANGFRIRERYERLLAPEITSLVFIFCDEDIEEREHVLDCSCMRHDGVAVGE